MLLQQGCRWTRTPAVVSSCHIQKASGLHFMVLMQMPDTIMLHNTNTHRSGSDQNAISMLWSRGHRIYTVTSVHWMLGEPSAAQSERFGCFLCSWRLIKNSSFNFLDTSSTLKRLPHHHSSHVHAVFFFWHCSQNVTVAGVDGSEFYARWNKY